MESVCRRDIARVNLDGGVFRDHGWTTLYGNDKRANGFGAELYRGDAPVDISGCQVVGYFMRIAGDGSIVIPGTASGNVAMVTLPAVCYAASGAFSLAIKVIGADEAATVRVVDGAVRLTQTEPLIAPDFPILSLDEVLAKIAQIEAAASDARAATAEARDAVAEARDAAAENREAAAEALNAAAESREAAEKARDAAQAASDSADGPPTVYCWGDSLTEGVGGWMATPDNVQHAIVTAYPDEVAKAYPCVNLGCRGETIQTIMARQGADPLVVGGFDIPASAAEDVVVGYLRGDYYSENRLGLATRSGDMAQPLKESEAGVNPCVIAGVEGELYRDMVADGAGRYAYRFRRLRDGAAVAVPEGSEVQTYAMRHYRGGIAVIWMGANGAVPSHTAYIQKLMAMIAYGRYSDYLVIIAREYTAQWVLEDAASIQKTLTDESGVCHLLYLPPELARRGYALAGIGASGGVIDTSSWTTTDVIKKNAPLLAYSHGGVAEDNFETLHFSSYGYRAIGRLVVERLGQLVGGSSGPGDPPADPGYVKDGEDVYGPYAYKLTRPMHRFGTVVDTGVALYDTEKDWTIAIRFEDRVAVSDGVLGSVFELREYFPPTEQGAYGKETAVYLRLWPQADGTRIYNFAAGLSMGFYFPFDNAAGYVQPTDGYHTAVIAKSGTGYEVYLDGGLAYSAPLSSQVPDEYRTRAKLTLFGRVENGNALSLITGGIADFRVYNVGLNETSVRQLLAEMATQRPA